MKEKRRGRFGVDRGRPVFKGADPDEPAPGAYEPSLSSFDNNPRSRFNQHKLGYISTYHTERAKIIDLITRKQFGDTYTVMPGPGQYEPKKQEMKVFTWRKGEYGSIFS